MTTPHDTTLAMVLCKGEQRFLFYWSPPRLVELYATLGRYAGDPNLPDFTWQEAALLANRATQLTAAKSR